VVGVHETFKISQDIIGQVGRIGLGWYPVKSNGVGRIGRISNELDPSACDGEGVLDQL